MALLGPTNTGKTHRAVQRMLEWPTGMIGLPLRLLAREIFDRVSALVGERTVALVTGEEKRVPPQPRYWVCTVEAMPVEREVDFLAVDEIQLAAHPLRGHVFTDRLLHARGLQETWFMGADTMRPVVEQLLPTAHIRNNPRFSVLRAAGSCSLAALPPRSAVVTFSALQVYELAERVCRRKGGAAVVLGALSPKTRNAQVALYQSGEVDYMVATDAIGMGLNMDVDHVAFAARKKFDGRETRSLEPAELAQIAGRAGRHMNDGSFGTLAPLPPFPEPVNRAIETHRFPSERRLVWRNSEVDTSSLQRLIASLQAPPRRPQLRRVEHAEDFEALCHLAKQPEIRRAAASADAVALLWEVCQIPDFGGHLIEHHARLLSEVFAQLSGPHGYLDPDWMEQCVQRIDDTDGNIDTLMKRIELVRTWTYVSHHARWVKGARYWQQRTEAVEERLSDALHERLVQRFVQRSGPTPPRTRKRARRKANEPLAEDSSPDTPFQQLLRLKLALLDSKGGAPPGPEDWLQQLVDAPYERFRVDEAGQILTGDRVLAQMTRGTDRLRPEVVLSAALDAGAGTRSQLRRRLLAWTRDLVDDTLAPLRALGEAGLSPAGRGLSYQLEQGLGTVLVRTARGQLAHLTDRDRRLFSQLGVHLGKRVVYAPSLLQPSRVLHRVALCAAFTGQKLRLAHPMADTASWQVVPEIPRETYVAVGFPAYGPRAIRADLVEHTHRRLSSQARHGPFKLPRGLASSLGCSIAELPDIVAAFGYRRIPEGRYTRGRRRR
jgi:ATP-dependent RNA helicase SUPV3L1/SUV3